MPAKGTAAKSASGSSMSQYDVELDKRIKTIEDKLNILINCLNENSYVNQNFPKNSEGKRELSF